MARRGCHDAAAAARYLEADEWHAPGELQGATDVAGRILAAIRAGRRITVFGDFDVDGVCATAIAVASLRRHGADGDWLIPDRIGEGYGLTTEAVERLAGRGTSLILTVDNGITAGPAVDEAQRQGIEVIVTDHHRGEEGIPECPILHPRLSGYPCPDLCGAAVAWKLAQAIDGAAGIDAPGGAGDLDLVALATVADLVPLEGENRSIVRRGLEIARHGLRPGLRALAEASGCTVSGLDEADLGFRLGPRINAAGRLYRADAGVELLLTGDRGRAAEIASELDDANRERRSVERRVATEASAARRSLPEELREGPALVLAGSDWHPGVIGIVASRLVEEHGRPAVVVSVDSAGVGRGSGRSVPGFDLVGALQACSEHLVSFGGHAAAAGLVIEADRVEDFARALAARARAELGGTPVRPAVRIDAAVSAGGLTLELAEELERLGPFGVGNPAPCLLVPGARVTEQRTLGEGGGHTGFSVESGGHRARGVAFGRSGLGLADGERADLAVRLERNEWRGTTEPRVRLEELWPIDQAGEPEAGYRPRIEPEEWWLRFSRATWAWSDAAGARSGTAGEDAAGSELAGASRTPVGWQPGSAVAVAAELLTSGSRVLLLTADAARRYGLALGRGGLGRLCGAEAAAVSSRDGVDRIRSVIEAGPRCVVADYAALTVAGIVPACSHVVEVDPPAHGDEAALARRAPEPPAWWHVAWGQAEQEFAQKVNAERNDLVGALRAVYARLREAERLEGEELRALLEGSPSRPRDPESCGRIAAVLAEIGVASIEGEAGARWLGVVSSGEVDLEGSRTFLATRDRLEKGKRFLETARHPRTSHEAVKSAG